jgi:hypothetical protein
MPGSPPDLTNSKSSKSSSFHSSYQSDDNGMVSEAGNFEDIGLDDEAHAEADTTDFRAKTVSNPYDASFANDLRTTVKQRRRVPMGAANGNRTQRELTAAKGRPINTLDTPLTKGSKEGGLGLLPVHNATTRSRRGLTSPSTPSLLMTNRNRSSSPAHSTDPNRLSTSLSRSRRLSWQSNREKKSIKDLERECDEDDGDDLPDDIFLENIPISPRPPQERTKSAASSTSTSPERPPKEKIRSVGNGTSPIPAEQGVLRSPRSPRLPNSPNPGLSRGASMGQFPINHDRFSKGRAKSWTAALSELSPEAKALTEALEAHAEDEENKNLYHRRSFNSSARNPEKPRVKSAIAELPPLRRTDIMIDPLPISKEKEAVLSRTRPSWLPPKDPAEEKRHLKEYQRMMALSLEAEKKREADKKVQSTCRDDTASSLLRIWEEHVLPNWDNVIHQKRTRPLWWRGIAPRSRGAVWTKAIGNPLGLTDASFTAALRRAQALEKTIERGSQLSAEEERKSKWLSEIMVDARNTYPELKIFQPGGPLHDSLLDVLKAYAMYRSDIGYVHGTSVCHFILKLFKSITNPKQTIAAILLLNLPTPSAAFQALSNVLNRPIPLAFHTMDNGAISKTYGLVLSSLQHRSPRLHALLTSEPTSPKPEHFLKQMFTGLFTDTLSFDNATRLWDIMVFEGDAVLVRAAVAYIITVEARLLGAVDKKEICKVIKEGLQGMGEEDWIKELKSAGKS